MFQITEILNEILHHVIHQQLLVGAQLIILLGILSQRARLGTGHEVNGVSVVHHLGRVHFRIYQDRIGHTWRLCRVLITHKLRILIDGLDFVVCLILRATLRVMRYGLV